MIKKQQKTKQLALNATPQEVVMFEEIKDHHQRKSDSDMLRFLIVQESKKILSQK